MLWNGENRDTGFVSSRELVATIRASDVAVAGTAFVSVSNPGPGGGQSATARVFSILNPAPAVAGLEPSQVWAGGSTLTLTVTGQRFTPSSVVLVGGNDVATKFLSPERLEAQVPPESIGRATALNVRVFTPAPGGGLSEPVFLKVRDDDQPPVTTVQGLDGLWHRRPVTLRFAATDVGLGVMATFYRFGRSGTDNIMGAKVTVRAPADHANDGVHIVQFWSVDVVGNVEDPPNEVQVGIDTTPPSTSVIAAAVKRGASFAPRYRVDDLLSPRARDARLQISDVKGKVLLKASLGQPATRTLVLAPPLNIDLPKGTYKMRVLAHDLAGNSQAGTKTALLRVD